MISLDYKSYKEDQENFKSQSDKLKIIDEIISTTASVNSDWKSTKEEFVKSIENSASSNLNMLINDFIYYFEKRFRGKFMGL